MGVTYAVTVFNKAGYLPSVLEAIAAEHAATGGEIVIVDDGSTDASPQLLSVFAKVNPAVRVISQANAGVAAATNAVLAAAACLHTRLIDGDDVIAPCSTQALLAALQQTGCGFAYGLQDTNGAEARQTSGAVRIENDPLASMLKRQPFIPSQTLGVTKVMQSVLPLPEGFGTSQDFSLGVLLSAHTRFAVLDRICCTVPAVSSGLSSSKARMFRDTALLSLELAARMGWIRRYRRLALGRWAGRARNYLRRHAPAQRRDIAWMAVMAAIPFAIPYRRGMACVISAYDRVLEQGSAP